jgi:hypothetical protein
MAYSAAAQRSIMPTKSPHAFLCRRLLQLSCWHLLANSGIGNLTKDDCRTGCAGLHPTCSHASLCWLHHLTSCAACCSFVSCPAALQLFANSDIGNLTKDEDCCSGLHKHAMLTVNILRMQLHLLALSPLLPCCPAAVCQQRHWQPDQGRGLLLRPPQTCHVDRQHTAYATAFAGLITSSALLPCSCLPTATLAT